MTRKRIHSSYGILLIILPFLLLSWGNTSQAQTIYYIDKDSLGGSCNDNGPGTLTQPWCSWFRKFWDQQQTLQPGEIVYIRAGVYEERFSFHPNSSFSGTAANPIMIQSYPGEEVIFDGASVNGNGLYIPGDNSYIHIMGPIEIKNFDKCMETSSTDTNYGWVLENIEAHSCRRGLLIRNFDGFMLRHSLIHHTNGDGEAGGVFMSSNTTNVLLEDVISHSHNDGRGIEGDADGFWADETTGTLVLKNVIAYGNSEDGFDLKAGDVTINQGWSYDNTTVGFKFWFGHYDVRNFVAYNNGEDGLKCSEAEIEFSNLTIIGNLESGLQFRTVGCTGTIQNSIFANNRLSAIEFPRMDDGQTVNVTLSNNIYTHNTDPVIVACNAQSYSANDIESGLFDQSLKNGIDCGVGYGTIVGSDTQSVSKEPLFINMPPVAISSRLSAQTTTLTSTSVLTGSYPWPGYTVGDFVELDNDNILREVTRVENPDIYFENNPLADVYHGRNTDGRGVHITDWGAINFDVNDDYRLSLASPALNTGVLVSGVHCARADDDGTAAMDPSADCIHWYGSTPDRGAYEYIPDLILWGTPTNQAIRLNWTIKDPLPITSTWQIDYQNELNDIYLPVTAIISPTRTYTLTELINDVLYTVTLKAILANMPILTDTVVAKPALDKFIYLPLVLKE